MPTSKFLTSDDYIKSFTAIQQDVIRITQNLGHDLKPGMSEIEVATAYAARLSEVGLKEHWYPILVLSGANSGKPMSRRFHLPDTTIIQTSDIVILDCTPINGTVWGNWSETFIIGENSFYSSLADDCTNIVKETAQYARLEAKTIGDIFNYCTNEIKKRGLTILDPRNDVGHSIFQVPIGQTVDKTPLEQRIFLSEEYKDAPLSGIISIEPQVGRVNPINGIMYGSKQQEVIIYS